MAPWRCLAAALFFWASGSAPASWATDAPVPATSLAQSDAKTKEAKTTAKPTPPKRQTPAEADEALARLMAQRKPVRAATARGQTMADAPPFKVVPRQDRIRNFPCTKCHDNKFVDTRVRPMQEEHTKLTFEHGGGRFWCYDACHKGTDIDALISLRGRRISYDESYKVCGQCHFQRLDWFFGGHGKRQGAWEDQRKIPVTADELKVEDRNQGDDAQDLGDAGRRKGETLMAGPDLSRRDFLTRGLGGRIAALLGSGVAVAPVEAIGGVRPTPDGDISARDLRRMSRDEARQALSRIRAQRGTR